jgi:flavin-dependent dehydrogenase
MIDADVVIVGGGPAGCSTALALRRRGYSAAIIAAPGRCDKPTETSVPALAQILRGLGASEALGACEACFGICSAWGRKVPALQSSIMDPHGHAWFIHRGRFDKLVQQAARNSGAIWLEATAQAVDFDNFGVSVRTTGDFVRARWLVAATGSPAWPARITGQNLSKLDSLVAIWAHLPVSLDARLLFVEPTDFGWWYVCPDDGAGAVGCLVTDPLSARALGVAQLCNWNDHFRATQLFRQLEGASAESVHVTSASLSALPRTHGQRWIVVGDAAAKLDPLGSAGTVTALDSGQRAARAVVDALQGNALAIQRYESWSSSLVSEFARQRSQHYSIEQETRSSEFWNRRMGVSLLRT